MTKIVGVMLVFLVGCAEATSVAPPVAVASSEPAPIAAPAPAPAINEAWATTAAASPTKEAASGTLVYDAMPNDAAEVYQDGMPIAVDVGDPVAASVGLHKVEVVANGLVVWAAKINVTSTGAAHVRIPAKYATAYDVVNP